ncbi:MAG: MFS transporter [Pyrinomonadaceae bacterium]|nr:MFS transporter [Pyrinomonadaceae bacterium]
MTSLTYMQLLRGNRSFRRLLVGQVISELGNWFNFIAGLGLVRAVMNGAPEATAILLVLRMAPFAVFAPVAGAFVDRWSRRRVMIVTDFARAIVALGFLLVRKPEDLWIAYACTILSTLLAAFFEAAKNAATPNIAGDRGLLAGNALMFSSRFLLMSIGAALGGAASARFGYEAAFVINAVSFLISAYSIWLIPESETKQEEGAMEVQKERSRSSFWQDMREGWSYIARHKPVAAILLVNILWATGGGAFNLIADRLGGVIFVAQGGLQGDAAVAAFYAAGGMGLFLGMILARRVGAHLEMRRATASFIGWTLFAHGVIFALMGLAPNLWWACALMMVSRLLLGVEFAVQETLLMRLVPDGLRGRVSTTDRAMEILVFSVSTGLAGWSLHAISPRALTVVSGLLSATPGIVWLALVASRRLSVPELSAKVETEDAEEAAFASAG